MTNVFEVPPGPHVDSRGILEEGEISESHALEGGSASALVRLSNGVRAFFFPEVNSLELAAYWADSLLGFGLVPAVAARPVNNKPGLLKQLIEGAKPALYYKAWEDLVQPQELLRAAVFDYILDSRDRRRENFLVDENRKKLWLVNNDQFMLLSSFNSRDVLNSALKKGLTDLPPDILSAIDRFYAGSPALIEKAKEKEIIDVLNRARERAKTALDKKSISNT
jgi:hypothetical protein